MEETTFFKFGIEGLEERYRNVLAPGTILIIGGHPGTGKTTMAMHLCRANAIEGKKCLYISTQEPEEKFLKHASRLGFDFYTLIASDLFRYYRYPMGSTEDTVENLIESLREAVVEYKPRIIVIDSINSFVAAVKDDTRRRALLQNFFYNIAFETKGLVVLLAEVPLGKKRIDNLGDIEFVADNVILLRLISRSGHLYRRLLLRKLRGAPITLAELPYVIKSNSGIKVIAPAPSPLYPAEPLRMCKQTRGLSDEIRLGDNVGFVSIGYSISAEIPIGIMMRAAYHNKMRLAIISYSSGDEIRTIVDRLAEKLGTDKELVSIYSINAYELSLDELLDVESEIIKRDGANMALRIGTETLEAIHGDRSGNVMRRFLILEKHLMRSMGVLSARLTRASDMREVSKYLTVFDLALVASPGSEGQVTVVKTATGDVHEITIKDLHACIEQGLP